MGDFELNNNEIFDTNSLTFETGNPVADGFLNVGVRLAIGAAAVVAGNAIYWGGKKGFEAIGAKIEESKAAAQAAQAAAQQAIAQQQAQAAIPQQAPQAQPGQMVQQAPFEVVNPDGTVVSAGPAPQNVQQPQQAPQPQAQPQMQAAPQQ